MSRRYTVSRRCKGVSVFGDLDLRRGKRLALRPFLQPAHEERLATAVLAAHGLERAASRGHSGQLVVQCRVERLEADREHVETLARHGSAPEGVHDLAAPLRTDHGPSLACLHPVQREKRLRRELFIVCPHRARVIHNG